MRVTVEPERCVGSGQCVMVAPDVFDIDDYDGMVVLVRPETEQASAVRDAVNLCPARAISVIDAAS